MKIQVKVTIPVEITDAEIPMLRDSMRVLTTPELKARIQEGIIDAAEEAANDYMGLLYARAERGR